MVDNFRPPQPVNERTMFSRSFSVPDIPLSMPHHSAVKSYSPFSEAYKWSKAAFKSYATRFLGIFDHPYLHRYNFCRSRPCWLRHFQYPSRPPDNYILLQPAIRIPKNIDLAIFMSFSNGVYIAVNWVGVRVLLSCFVTWVAKYDLTFFNKVISPLIKNLFVNKRCFWLIKRSVLWWIGKPIAWRK